MPPEIGLRGMSGTVKGQTWRSSALLRIGRLDVLELVLEDPSVSRIHAEVRWTDRGWVVRDLGSTGGTLLNGVAIGAAPMPLRTKDVIQIGAVALLVEASNEPSALDRLAASTTPEERASALGAMALSTRKLRLFACACCRSEWQTFPADAILLAERHRDGLMNEEELQAATSLDAPVLARVLEQVVASRAVDIADRHADGLASDKELEFAHRVLGRYGMGMAHVATAPDPMRFVSHHLLGSLEELVQDRGRGPRCLPTHDPIPWRGEYVSILREMVGPSLSRCITVNPAWLASNDGAVWKLAKSIYDEHRFDDLPVLGDALEDAGCANAEILRHCQEPGRHWRGCWVIELLLGYK